MRALLAILMIFLFIPDSIFAESTSVSLVPFVFPQMPAFFENLSEDEKKEMKQSLSSSREKDLVILEKKNDDWKKSKALKRQREIENESKVLTKSEQEIYARGLIKPGERIAGGFTGMIFGFGIGHLVMNRYTTTALVFTVSNVVGAGVLAWGFISMERNSSELAGLALIPGFCIMGLVKIIETLHVWIMPAVHNSNYREIEGRIKRGARPVAKFHFTPVIATTRGVAPGIGLAVEFF